MGYQEALYIVRKEIQNDKELQWSWHCNIAMNSYDEGLNHSAANRAASRFMKLLLDVDMTKHPNYARTQEEERLKKNRIGITPIEQINSMREILKEKEQQ